MLSHLQIRDFAIIEAVELELQGGFTALTGETGAGKSILVDALLLATGGRADSGAVRHGAQRAEVSASFSHDDNPAARRWLEEQSLDGGEDCVLRRVVAADGRSRAWINGQTVPLQSLRALGELLLDVHGQLEFQSLTRRSYQRELLDGCGAGAELETVQAAFAGWSALDQSRSDLSRRATDREARLEMLQHYLAELEALALANGETASLMQERRRVAARGRLAEGAAQLDAALGDEGAAAALARAQTQMRPLLALDESLAGPARLIDEASVACREAAMELRRYLDALDADPARQDWLESRLAAIESVARKHRVQPDALPQLRSALESEYAELRDAELSLAALDRRLEQARGAYARAAERLSLRRTSIASELDRRVEALLQGLGMPGGRLSARVLRSEPLQLSAHGGDDIEFLVSANPGQPLRPMAKVASGGELSRISLALQVATLAAGRRPCLVFDEVDAGVGGAVAEMVGRQLRGLSASGQVLCVTHLAQVAAQADRQWRVSKSAAQGTTRTTIEPLDAAARVEELARMLGGSQLTDAARAHAREMLQGAAPAAGPSPGSRGGGSSRARSARAGSGSGP